MLNNPSALSRRDALLRAGGGAGLLGLASLFKDNGLLLPSARASSVNPLDPRPAPFPTKAKSVIWLFMNGGPSQVDTWDYKPELVKRDGKKLDGFDKKTGFFVDAVGPLMKSPFSWAQYGRSGTWVSDLFPHMSRHVDKMAFIQNPLDFTEFLEDVSILIFSFSGNPNRSNPGISKSFFINESIF